MVAALIKDPVTTLFPAPSTAMPWAVLHQEDRPTTAPHLGAICVKGRKKAIARTAILQPELNEIGAPRTKLKLAPPVNPPTT